MWSLFSHRTEKPLSCTEIREFLVRLPFFLLTFAVFSLFYCLPHILHLSHIAFFSLHLSSFLRVRELNEWLILRVLREGKSVVISKLSGILCLRYESYMHHFLDSWCEYADIVGWDNTSAVIQYTMRVHSHLCEAICTILLNTQTNTTRIQEKVKKKQIVVLVLTKITTLHSVSCLLGEPSLS